MHVFSARFVGGWGFNPLPLVPLKSQPPVFIDPTGLVKNTLLTPLWFYHKSSTVCLLLVYLMMSITSSPICFVRNIHMTPKGI